jgi:hypothetical protein
MGGASPAKRWQRGRNRAYLKTEDAMESYSTALCVWALALGVLVAAPSGRGHVPAMTTPAHLKWADIPSPAPGIKIAINEGDDPRRKP